MNLKKLDVFLYKTSLISLALLGIICIVIVKSEARQELSLTSPLSMYTMGITSFQLSRLTAAILYKRSKTVLPFDTDDEKYHGYEPLVSIVIPCKNEEEVIEDTVRKCFEADYPKNKLEVIVINDGSTDNTLRILNKLKKEYKKLTIVDWKKNRGKRHGMAEGFKRANGEIVVQLDSDSYIDPETFRNIVVLFEDPSIGAISAHTEPINADKNWLTKMQAAYYFAAFRILKAAESTFMTVFCCSGCASAYRKSVVYPILDQWLAETFLGLPVTWGDDRALTNWVLRKGFRTIYTDSVRAYTLCPDTFKKFLKQQIRWKKGWFVNSVFASKFIFKKEPFVALTYFFPLIVINLLTPFMTARALIYNPLIRGIAPIYYIAGVYLVALVTTTYYRFLSRENKYWPYMFAWSTINMAFLSFLLFYALATIQNRKWGTR